jgi:GalNAc-alpha-(1->4)-GalNAc-alpha-(1->3)-diNAcBac-PP-undecaprenol alpha-1,4-N-acetyl-D-galactosaminyltransferase
MDLEKLVLCVPSLQAGGMERVMAELTTNFSKEKNLRIHLVLYGINRDVFYQLPHEVIVHQPPFLFNNSRRVFSTIRTLFYLRREIKRIKPRTVLSFGEVWNNFVLLALYGTEIPVVVSDRCQPNKSLGTFHDFLRRQLYRHAKFIVCQTQQAKEIFEKSIGSLNYCVIGNPIRQSKILNEAKEDRIILSVGRLIATKNFNQLISIFASIGPVGWKLVIVGDDAQKQQNKIKLENQIIELGLQGKVILAGKQVDVESYYRNASIFAFTSSSEGFPNVIGEAMSAGLPVVAYDCVAGPADLIVNEETGFLIPLHNQLVFAQKLESLMLDSSLRKKMGEEGSRRVLKFESKQISNQFLEVLLQ